MTRCLTTCSVEIMRPEQYDIPCGDEDEEYDDDFDDDDELDGYDGFSDLDDGEIEDGRPVAYHGNGLDDERARNVSRRHRSMSEGSELILEAGDDNRRDHHNQLERKRRASIKTSYNDLREAIPSLRGSKASRAVILQRAVECIEELVKRNRDHTHCVETLRRQNDLLDSRVQELQRTVQRLEGEEAATASLPLGTTIGPPTMNGTLRLYSGTLAASGSSGSCSSSLPIYRLMPQDSSDRRTILRFYGCLQVKTNLSVTSTFRVLLLATQRVFHAIPKPLNAISHYIRKPLVRPLCLSMNEQVPQLIAEQTNSPNIDTVYVYRSSNSGDSRIEFELYVTLSSPNNWSTRIRLNRLSSESVSSFLDRLTLSVLKAFQHKLRKKSSKLSDCSTDLSQFGAFKAELLKSPSTDSNPMLTPSHVDETLCLEEVFFAFPSSTNPAGDLTFWLRLIGPSQEMKLYKVVRNPARVINCRLRTLPMVGCPLVPFLETDNASLTRSEFLWFLTRSTKWPTKPCHTGLIFTPGPEHLGCRVRLNVRPRDEAGQPGIPFGTSNQWQCYGDPVECAWPITEGPKQVLHAERLKAVGKLTSPREFRVLSYNLLADMYCSMEGGRRIFRHCPEEYLDRSYRLPLLLRQLLSFNADFLCLQEVDASVFHRYLGPALRYSCNMDGLYLPKRKFSQDQDGSSCTPASSEGEKGEGCAIFYRTDRFKLIEENHVPSLMLYAETNPFVSELLKRPLHPSIALDPTQQIDACDHDRQCSYSQCLAAALFRILDAENGTACTTSAPILIGSTHFYFSPTADFWRYIQACAVRQHLNDVANRAHCQLGLPVSIILCGDINQRPHGPAFNALLDDAHGLQASSLPLRLSSAYSYDSESFTNWVPGFKASLDVILYSADSGLKCVRTLPLPRQDQIVHTLEAPPAAMDMSSKGEPVTGLDVYALPNKEFPSDHLPLLADFHLSN
ncbi:unnamed protein product [Dicrocoelium dendriticum]|nr:unnamed protein product [Dicrocoelium dendriticum]